MGEGVEGEGVGGGWVGGGGVGGGGGGGGGGRLNTQGKFFRAFSGGCAECPSDNCT